MLVSGIEIESLEIWSSAYLKTRKRKSGASSYKGIIKLRELILKLALLGKIGSNLDIHKWEDRRLDGLYKLSYGKNLPTKLLMDEGYPVFGANGLIGYYENYHYEDKKLLISCRGAYSGAPNISPKNCFVTNNSIVCDPIKDGVISNQWGYFALKVLDKSTMISGTAQPQVTIAKAKSFLLPIPPLEQQKRIVAKVDELMGLIDDLEAQTETARESHAELVDALLRTLVESEDANALTQNWTTLSTHFNTLFTTEESVDKLREAIQKLAIMGSLCLQNDAENAKTLFTAISDWRESEIAAKRIRAPRKTLKPIGISEQATLPSSWATCRLGELIYIKSGDGLTAKNMIKGPIPVFGGNGINGYHNDYNVNEEEIVIGRVGYYCGSIHVTPLKAWVTDNAFVTHYPKHLIFRSFLALLLRSTNLKADENATAQPVISGSKIYPIVVGLPPFEEQKRIVAKTDKLMTLCDDLIENIRTSEALKVELAESVVHHASSS